MRLDDFDYDLPEERIAQEPPPHRTASRLLVLPREQGPIAHRRFQDLGALLRHGDLLVLNDTRVMPARLFGRKRSGGRVELLLDRPLSEPSASNGRIVQDWCCLIRASKPLRAGAEVELEGGAVAEGLGADSAGVRIRLRLPAPVHEYLERHGRVPLPAYIRRDPAGDPRDGLDRERYQTVFARRPGAVAAPTAGLHFDPGMLAELRALGVELASCTLHVGPGTFLPVRCQDITAHEMHPERYALDEDCVRAVARTRLRGGRVVAVGTTVLRALESAWGSEGLRAGEGLTELFIYPGFEFHVVDVLLTNFHLPRSTLLMLVCAFSERRRVLDAYAEAVRAGYRFYSYGDAMLLC
ncbi:MAG: tRNA preQ1(34) S-adenosylmethionine ribosyltransferase-isomerase QueA [Deltaproteobacteria bacterium]|nr:tRNA preQ1(34) S-adenosylmethionine ribosyltransferase-isomerase QueA [Deltaproteobacteria bacterium]